MLHLLDKIRLKLFLVFALIAGIFMIIANAMPNWSHGWVTIGKANTMGLHVASAKWSPWTLCFVQTTGQQFCVSFSDNMHLGLFPNTPVNVTAGGEWSSVQAARAFSILSILVGFGGIAMAVVSFFVTLSLKQELIITSLSFTAAFFGFLTMCIWAGYANTDLIEYGSSFTLVVFSWILFVVAGVVGNWERFDGIPETGKRFISLGAVFVVWLGQIVSISLTNWLHQQVSAGVAPIFFVYTGTFGLFKACVQVLVNQQSQAKTCSSWSSLITVPYQVTPTSNFNFTVPASQLSEVRASEAFGILAVLCATATLVAVFIGFWKRDDTGPIAKWRIPLMGVTVFWSIMVTIMWADLFRKDSSQDVEYGGGFALNLVIWIIGLVWMYFAWAKGTPPAASVASGGAGFGYVVTTGDNAAYQDTDKF